MTQLVVISDHALRQIQLAIVEATHTATDTAGERIQLATIDSIRLEAAARLALGIATGEVIWPDTARLRIARPKRPAGIFEET